MTTLISISFVSIYISIVTKRRIYGYGGLLSLSAILVSLAYAKDTLFISFVERSIPWISGKMLLWLLYLLFGIAFTIFMVHGYREEKSGKYTTTSRDDFMKTLKPNIANITFWTFIIFLNVIAFVIEK